MLNTQELTQFLESQKALQLGKPVADTMAAKLLLFFQQIAPLLPKSQSISPVTQVNPTQLQDWLEHIKQPLIRAKQGGLGFNPWIIANIKRDEVRNSAVLAWLLNPNGNHGLGKLALCALVRGIPELGLSEALNTSSRCSVRTESNPDGDRSNRVDIEIDADHFYLLIEVKIDAAEGIDQLSRYGALCEQRAASRPWAILFLTTKRSMPKTAGNYAHKIHSVSWLQVAQWLSSALKQHTAQRTNPDKQEILTRESINCFLSYIRTF
ncbi:PD-(D/E)XK nuclease family protein [Chitinibacter fontanus]|uniref:PD-(D/E)XK nuclease family protein n=1 Tax=Chitinibacter fontanus TaxID=1737446 RepID=A0A7D5ZES9_9NEIS|nr:PD-(D/E)XK nuclease family protein [Chitinibacter fontanus]QLI82645.1 PD-(D/E)XK nuclease family protein [Chitinibacter fontanus]